MTDDFEAFARAHPLDDIPLPSEEHRSLAMANWHNASAEEREEWAREDQELAERECRHVASAALRNPYCSNCGDIRGGAFGHETSECTWSGA